jgi:hypothetical protein
MAVFEEEIASNVPSDYWRRINNLKEMPRSGDRGTIA